MYCLIKEILRESTKEEGSIYDRAWKASERIVDVLYEWLRKVVKGIEG